MEERIKGTVKFFDNIKLFGFIVRDDHKGDVFVHISDLINVVRLEQGDKVEFNVAEGPRGRKAINVEIIGDSDGQQITSEAQQD